VVAARGLEEDRRDSETRVEKSRGAADATMGAEGGEKRGEGDGECADMQMRGGHPRVTNF